MDRIRHWWRQPDHYQWLSAYLDARKLQPFTRKMMASIVILLAFVPMLLMLSPNGPQAPVPRVVAFVVTLTCSVIAILWLLRWPTRRQSAAFVIFSTIGISATCLLDGRPVTGIQGCTAFAALAGYVAFFHTSRYLAFTLLMAFGTGIACAVEIAARGDVALAVSSMIVLGIGVLAVPFSVQVMVHTLGLDALRSDTDPLTELHNRRGFRRSVRILASESRQDVNADLSIVMVDLDDFKRINDTSGHAAGDWTLKAVADILRHSRRGDSVVGRVGGEEFVVAVSGDRRDAIGLAERIRHDIAQVPLRVTASIGVASSTLGHTHPRDVPAHVDYLLDSADRAMYQAKRAGGNQVYVVGWPTAVYVEKPTANKMTATRGRAPWTTAERAFSGADARSTAAAANIEPTPANTNAAPTRVPPKIVNATPTRR